MKQVNWKWVEDESGATASIGCLGLDVWHDGGVWFVAFDIFGLDRDVATDYGNRYKTKGAAKKAAERLASRWLDKLEEALKKNTKKAVDSKRKKL